MTERSTHGERGLPGDLGLLVVAVFSIAASAILARWADAPAMALAFWRTLGGAVLLAPAAARSAVRPTGRQWPLLLLAGLALALHFSTWLGSLELTTVAASVTLVATAPVFVAAWFWVTGRRDPARRPGRRTWTALTVTFAGAVIITGGDALTSPGRLDGDALALVGAVAMATYLVVGDRLRTSLPTAAYAAPTYAIAALGLLLAAQVGGSELTGFDRSTWLAIVLMTIGPQLGGHTVLNALLPRLGSITVSLALLTEPVGAALLAWLFLAEAPTAAVWVGTPMVLIGLAIQISGLRPPGQSTNRLDHNSS